MGGGRENDIPKDVKFMVPLKYLSSFWETLDMPSINCKSYCNLVWKSFYNGCPC